MPHVSIGHGLSGSEPPIIIKTDQRRQHALILGKTGVGKSTLARILCGIEVQDEGDIARRRGARIEYLAQEPELPSASTARAVVGCLQPNTA